MSNQALRVHTDRAPAQMEGHKVDYNRGRLSFSPLRFDGSICQRRGAFCSSCEE